MEWNVGADNILKQIKEKKRERYTNLHRSMVVSTGHIVTNIQVHSLLESDFDGSYAKFKRIEDVT